MFAGTNETIEVIYAAAASVAAMVAAGNDLKNRRIPNALTGSSLVCGLGLHFSTGGFRELYLSALAGLLVGGVFAVLYAAGGMGAGDVKLMAAVGCLAGLRQLTLLLTATVVSGALLAVVIAMRHRQLQQTLFNTWKLVGHHREQGLQVHPELNAANTAALRMPYAVPIAAGCLVGLCKRILQQMNWPG